MMRLYSYFRSSSSYRVRLALAHKDLPFELSPVPLLEGAQRVSEHRDRNPLGQVPVLELDGLGTPVYLSQSLAILEYLEETHPAMPLLPKTAVERARVRELAELINSGIQPFQNLQVVDRVRQLLHSEAETWVHFFVRAGLAALEQRAQATAGAFLVGELPSFADVCLVPQLYSARRFHVPLDGLDTLLRVEERALRLPRWEQAHPDRQPDAPPTPATP